MSDKFLNSFSEIESEVGNYLIEQFNKITPSDILFNSNNVIASNQNTWKSAYDYLVANNKKDVQLPFITYTVEDAVEFSNYHTGNVKKDAVYTKWTDEEHMDTRKFSTVQMKASYAIWCPSRKSARYYQNGIIVNLLNNKWQYTFHSQVLNNDKVSFTGLFHLPQISMVPSVDDKISKEGFIYALGGSLLLQVLLFNNVKTNQGVIKQVISSYDPSGGDNPDDSIVKII